MHIHPEEIRWAQVNEKQLPFEPLTKDQVRSIMERGRELHRWYKSHHAIHCLINLLVLIVLLGGDYLALLKLPGLWLTARSHNAAGANRDCRPNLWRCSIAGLCIRSAFSPCTKAPLTKSSFRPAARSAVSATSPPIILLASPAESPTSTPKNT